MKDKIEAAKTALNNINSSNPYYSRGKWWVTFYAISADEKEVIKEALEYWISKKDVHDVCGYCNQPIEIENRVIKYHLTNHQGRLPLMPCEGSGTEEYIAANCECGRVIDECRCGSGERD